MRIEFMLTDPFLRLRVARPWRIVWALFAFAIALASPLPVLGAGAPLAVVPAPAADALAAAMAQTRPWQFAVPIPVDMDSDVDGSWQEVGDQRIWKLQLHSPLASSVSLHFDQWHLPPEAEMYLHAVSRNQTQGPFHADSGADGELWTSMILDDSVELELRSPRNAAQPRVHIASVHHGFRSSDPASGFQTKAGACNIDVACEEAAPFEDQVNASVLITISGTGACSATLINNTQNDQTPYLLTADHCGISTRNDQSVVTYFNFRRSSCGGDDTNRDPQQSRSGTRFLAGSPDSDFTLVRMTEAPDAAWNPFWAGWSISTEAADSGAGVHHPSGDEKAISLYSTPLVAEEFRDFFQTVEVWRVNWSAGTTEQGSSGSAIFDANGLVRGQLYGGEASCSDPSAPDFYGRLDASWDSSTDSRQQLKAWLDPEDSGAVEWGGLDAAGNYRAPSGTSPSPTPTATPTITPTATPTASVTPTTTPTVAPSASPTPQPTPGTGPTPVATVTPTASPTPGATTMPSATPTVAPTSTPPPGADSGSGALPLNWLLLLLGLALARSPRALPKG